MADDFVDLVKSIVFIEADELGDAFSRVECFLALLTIFMLVWEVAP